MDRPVCGINKEQKNQSATIQITFIPNHTSHYLDSSKLCMVKCAKNKDPTKGEVTVSKISQNNVEQAKLLG